MVIPLCTLAITTRSTPRNALFVWNASASAPIGFYRAVHDGAVSRGDLVLAIPTVSVGIFAAARGYLPLGVPLVKRVAGVSGNTICAVHENIFINGRRVAIRLAIDHKGRALPGWSGCHTLAHDEIFLLMADVHDSFDGRYFGPLSTSQIAARLEPLWIR